MVESHAEARYFFSSSFQRHCEEEVDIVVECKVQYFDKLSSCRKCNLNEQCKPMKVQYKDFLFCVKDKDEAEDENKEKDKEKEN